MQVLAVLTATAVVLLARHMLPAVTPAGARATELDGVTGIHAGAVPPPPLVKVTWPTNTPRNLFDWESALEAPRQTNAETMRLEAIRVLRLQATISADPPRAIINGRVVRVGEAIELFRVVQIKSRGVILERDGVLVELNP